MSEKNEVRQLSIGALDRITEDEPRYLNKVWEGEEITITPSLGLREMLTYIDGVVNGCFTENGEYMPEARGFTERCAVLELYGNVRLPRDTERRYTLVYSEAVTRLYNYILSEIDRQQYEEIERAIGDKISYKAQSNIDNINRQITKLADQIAEVAASLQDVFGDMSQEDVKKLTESLIQGVDEEKLAKAVVAAQGEVRRDTPAFEVIDGGKSQEGGE